MLRNKVFAGLTLFFLLFLPVSTAYGIVELPTYQEILDWINSTQPEPAFKPGDVITYKDIEKLKPFIPREFWPHLFFEGMSMRIVKPRDMSPPDHFLEATKKFSPQVKLGPKGELINYVAGFPFPPETISPDDPQAGLKLAWDFNYRWWGEGIGATGYGIDLMSPGGKVDRHFTGQAKWYIYSHRTDLADTNYIIPVKKAKDFEYKEWLTILEPFDVKDTTFCIFRYNDPFKDDDGWAYIPALRRVRRMSMASRADSFMGSEWNFDDFLNFSGKVLAREWKYLGRKKILDPVGRRVYQVGHYGGPFQVVPVGDEWQLVDTFIVELTPKWERHPYGRKLLYLDAQNMMSTYASCYDKKGDLWKTFMLGWRWSEEDPEELLKGELKGIALEAVKWNKGKKIKICNLLSTVDWQGNKATRFYQPPGAPE
jgi:hypothetical protein